MREYLRHPSNIPVEVEVVERRERRSAQACDVSIAGLCCEVDKPVQPGSDVTFKVPSLSVDYTGHGRVVWCKPSAGRYQLGIEFCSGRDAYRARMVEQICQIEDYRCRVAECEGRSLDGEEAAAEWISRFAATFHQRFAAQ
ncbi:PilZ domain-containing protein [Spongiibacter sp.]|uniref:PilZ domain-containing protein n=1 Tax=Spongiibacter sp. TaxID=2024860 RepID=UPI0035668F26